MILGIYEDTGCLTFSSTTPADLEAAAYLLAQGADNAGIAQPLVTVALVLFVIALFYHAKLGLQVVTLPFIVIVHS